MRPITQQQLEQAALNYLGRYGSTQKNFQAVLKRKIMRRLPKGEGLTSEHEKWINEITTKCIKYNYLNDIIYAELKIKSMHNSGKSERSITENLKAKGVAQSDIEMAFKNVRSDGEIGGELGAAITFARKRRIGPFRQVRGDAVDYELKQKEFAKMARGGFDFDLIKRIIDARDEDDLSEL